MVARSSRRRVVATAVAAMLVAGSALMSTAGAAGAVTPVTSAAVSGKVLNLAGKGLVDPWCVYFWPESAEAPGGWARSSECVDTDERGVFATVLPLGRYKVEVEATNVAYGMFVGGATLDVATTLTVGPKGLKGLKLKVATLAVVAGQFVDLAAKALVNPNCVYFWYEDAEAESGWSVPDECFEIDPDGFFSAYVAPGKYKLEVQADNIALSTFFGGQNTLATATPVVVPAAGLAKQVFKMPTQPPFSGKVTALDGSNLPVPDALYLWTEDPTADSGWSVSGDIWDMDSKGTFSAYLVPQKYRIQIVYGTPKVRTFFGGATIEEATTFLMPVNGLTGVMMRVGRGSAPAEPTGLEWAPRDGGLIVAWDAPPAGSVTYTRVTASPSGATCITTGTTCTLTGLRNGVAQAVSVARTNESGTTTTDITSAVPAVPVLTLRSSASMVTAGSVISLRLTNAAPNGKVTIAGKPGVTTTNLNASRLGSASTDLTLAAAGVVSITATIGKSTAKTTVYVPMAKFTTTVKRGKALTFSIAAAKPGSAVQFSVSNGRELVGVATSKGAYAGKLIFPSAGRFTVTATVGDLTVRTATITVTN